MKLDWQVLKSLLEKFEDESIQGYLKTVGEIPTVSQLENFETREKLQQEAKAQERLVFGHLLLLLDGRLVDGLIVKAGGNFDYSYGLYSPRLTLLGHELLENLRSQSVLGRLKKCASSVGAPITIETISAIAAKVINEI